MTIRILKKYEAIDGKWFDKYLDCKRYEKKLLKRRELKKKI